MFKQVLPKPDFPKMEREILKWWYKSSIVQKYLRKNDSSKKRFSFLDGPITANNPMGVHHAWGRTYKDLWQRYFNMKGYRQRFQNGFDCQGLWVEVEVEKELGFKNKKDIEKYGIAKFVEKCKERVRKFAKLQTEQSKRLGYFMDWGNSYYTMSEENNYMIWYFLKKCYQNGWLYKGLDSVPWCPRCGTAISQHEILQEEYQETTHKAVYVKYPIVKRSKEFLLIWTTTPWTLPANVAVAVHPELDYTKVKIKKTGESLILAKSKLSLISKPYEIVKKFKGKKLVGLTYAGPYDFLPAWKKLDASHRIISWDEVSEKEGTGLVHLATGGGHEDFLLGKKERLPLLIAIDEEAKYIDGFDFLSGKNAARNPQIILDDLQKRKFIYKIEDYTHRYPVCWRCKEELVWRAVDEWYIAMDKIPNPKSEIPNKSKIKNSPPKTLRKQMIEVAKKIRWIPEFGLERELDWLKNMEDWLISKKRYWGLALPIWECQECGNFEVIGSKEELKKRAFSGWEDFSKYSPHRPWIDSIKIKCRKCGEVVSRIPDVGNPWLDAGIIPFSTLIDPKTGKLSYTGDKKYFHEWFPADFITESFPGQFKNWFYSLIAMSTVLEKTNPYKTVLGFATLFAEDGRPMHKSLGNAIEFNEGADKIGVDVMRWMYVTQNPVQNLLFGYSRGDEVRRRFHLILWNVYKFFVTYANIDGWEPSKKFPIFNLFSPAAKSCLATQFSILDSWILSRLHQTIKEVTKSLDDYNAFTASHLIENFVHDLSTWYVRRSRQRIGPLAKNSQDKEVFYQTTHYVLVTLSKLLAPFTPFLAEEIFKNLTGRESVHITSWPKVSSQYINILIHKGMEEVRKICELGHAARKAAGIKVRQPLRKLKIKNSKLKVTVKSSKLSKEHGSPSSEVARRDSSDGGTAEEDRKELEKLIKDELNVKKIEWVKGKGELAVELDTKITPELKAEGEARELVRKIQVLRKKAGCKLDEKIIVYTPSWPKEFEKYILDRALACKILYGKELKIERR